MGRRVSSAASWFASSFLALTIALLLIERSGLASAPGITVIDQTFQQHTAVPDTDRPMMSATTVGGVFLYTTTNESACGTMSLRLAADPDRVISVNGHAIPPEGYELRESPSIFNPATLTCDLPNPQYGGASQIDCRSVGRQAPCNCRTATRESPSD